MTGKGSILLPVFAFLQMAGNTQDLDSERYHRNSYKLDLPELLLKPKSIIPITEILPHTFVELKERHFCTSGKAGYTIRLLIDSLEIYDEVSANPQEFGNGPETYFRYTFSFKYRFYAALVMFDSLERPISRLRLLTREELFEFSKDYSVQPNNGVYELEDVYNRNGTRVIGKRLVEKQKPYVTELPKHDGVSILSLEFMMGICRQKIHLIRKLIRELKGS